MTSARWIKLVGVDWATLPPPAGRAGAREALASAYSGGTSWQRMAQEATSLAESSRWRGAAGGVSHETEVLRRDMDSIGVLVYELGQDGRLESYAPICGFNSFWTPRKKQVVFPASAMARIVKRFLNVDPLRCWVTKKRNSESGVEARPERSLP